MHLDRREKRAYGGAQRAARRRPRHCAAVEGRAAQRSEVRPVAQKRRDGVEEAAHSFSLTGPEKNVAPIGAFGSLMLSGAFWRGRTTGHMRPMGP